MTRKIGDVKRDGLGLKHKTKARKHNETFLSLGFTVTQVDGGQRPRCVMSQNVGSRQFEALQIKKTLEIFSPRLSKQTPRFL